jgi:hypothetical protein
MWQMLVLFVSDTATRKIEPIRRWGEEVRGRRESYAEQTG